MTSRIEAFKRASFAPEIQRLRDDKKGTQLHEIISKGDDTQVLDKVQEVPELSRFDFLSICDENGESVLHLAADKKKMKLIYELLLLVPKDKRKLLLNLKDRGNNSVIETIALNISDENQEYLINIFKIFVKDEESNFLDNHSAGQILDNHSEKELAKKIKRSSFIKKLKIDESDIKTEETNKLSFFGF